MKRRVTAALLTGTLLLSACSAIELATDPRPAESTEEGAMTARESMNAATPDELIYDVSGTAYSAMVTYRTSSGTQQATVDLPMQNNAGTRGVRMQGSSIPDFAYISAQNQGETGTITCRITLNGQTISENTSSGAYAVVSCSS